MAGVFTPVLWSSAAEGASVSWSAPAACPNQSQVLERIEEARGGPLTEDRDMAFAANVAEEPNGQLTLTVHAPTGADGNASGQTRVLKATECEELVAALVQIVSLALGPAVAPEGTPSEATTPPEQTNAPPPTDRTDPASDGNEDGDSSEAGSPALFPRREENARIALLAVLDTASLGGSSLGAQVVTGVSLGPRFELRGVLGYFPPHTVAGVSNDEDAGGRFSLALAALLGCAAWSGTAWRLPLCAGVEGGRLSASGFGVEEPQSNAVSWFALRADALVGFELGARLRATLLAGLVVPLVRHDFSVAGSELLHIPPLSVRAGIGLEYAF